MRQDTAFVARSRLQVGAFHAAAIKAAGADNGPPGLRSAPGSGSCGYPGGYYAALVIGPDSNRSEAIFREGSLR
jgi:hypothetical protein